MIPVNPRDADPVSATTEHSAPPLPGVANTAPGFSDDEALEREIDRAYDQLVSATTREDREHWCRAMYRLIRSRSRERVAELERQRLERILG